MPRVVTKTKNKAGDPYDCLRCSDKIVAGEQYFQWSFRYGGTKRQHLRHGPPKQSQLTQSKMSGVYAAVESVEETIVSCHNSDDCGDLQDALSTCAEEVRNIKDEYEEAYNNLKDSLQQGTPGQEMQEKIDALDTFADGLETAASEIGGDWDGAEEEPDEPGEEPDEPSRENFDSDEAYEKANEDYTQEREEFDERTQAHEEWAEARHVLAEECCSKAEDALQELSI